MVTYLRNWIRLVAAFCLLIPLLGFAEQAPFFISFQAPGSTAIYPESINDLMVVTDYYEITFEDTRGFVRYADGSMTTFVVPESASTYPLSINHAGDITGYYLVRGEADLEARGFIRGADGTITTFGRTLSSGNSQPFLPIPIAINELGEVAGNVDSSGGNSSSIPFLRSPSGAISEFSLGPASTTTTEITGMNASGAVIGYSGPFDSYPPARETAPRQGFLWPGKGALPSPGSDATIPIIADRSPQTTPMAINAEGTIVGCYLQGKDSWTYFVRNQEGTITTLDTPGEVYSWCPVAINDAGTVVGPYSLGGGFIKPEHGALSTFSYPGSLYTWPTSVNNLDVITGYYFTGPTTSQGFLLIPSN